MGSRARSNDRSRVSQIARANMPFNSAIALTIPEDSANGQDNGLLQVREIFVQTPGPSAGKRLVPEEKE